MEAKWTCEAVHAEAKYLEGDVLSQLKLMSQGQGRSLFNPADLCPSASRYPL